MAATDCSLIKLDVEELKGVVGMIGDVEDKVRPHPDLTRQCFWVLAERCECCAWQVDELGGDMDKRFSEVEVDIQILQATTQAV